MEEKLAKLKNENNKLALDANNYQITNNETSNELNIKNSE